MDLKTISDVRIDPDTPSDFERFKDSSIELGADGKLSTFTISNGLSQWGYMFLETDIDSIYFDLAGKEDEYRVEIHGCEDSIKSNLPAPQNIEAPIFDASTDGHPRLNAGSSVVIRAHSTQDSNVMLGLQIDGSKLTVLGRSRR